MQLFGKVTILALAGGLLVFHAGCGSGGGHLPRQGQETAGSGAGSRPGAADSRVAQAVKLHRAGDLDNAASIVAGVLDAEPAHPGALQLQRALERTSFCTVYPGDTLAVIAGYYYGDGNAWTVLARANGIMAPKDAPTYARLRVPWFPDGETGRDELDRLQRTAFLGKKLDRIVMIPAGRNVTLESLARKHYGNERYGYFLADFNRLETRSGTLAPGTALKIPVFQREAPVKRKAPEPRPRSPEQDCLASARAAMESRDYDKGCECLAGLTQRPGSWPEGESLLSRCRAEGVAYHDGLGEASLEASRMEEACEHWQRALALDPGNPDVQRKLQETRDLIKTLASLPELP